MPSKVKGSNTILTLPEVMTKRTSTRLDKDIAKEKPHHTEQRSATQILDTNNDTSITKQAMNATSKLAEEPQVNTNSLLNDSLVSIPADFKYDATTPAVPLEVTQHNYDKIFEGKLHPRRAGQSVRREMTERRISMNIALFNSAVEKKNNNDLFIGRS